MIEYFKTIVNATTGEVLEEPMSQEEIEVIVAEQKRVAEKKALELELKQIRAEARARAIEKLTALGLTEEEVSSLLK